ncbi:MAG: hypothetical protein C4308_06140, partial [Chitinophagaceae bacterium]
TCVFYLVKAVEIAQQLNYKPKHLVGSCVLASHALYNTKNYRQCIEYCRYALKHKSLLDSWGVIAAQNNLGLCYQKTGNYDS